jgi:endogenous inhibitor of DNA gyrase (YacG/DUF329 family)
MKLEGMTGTDDKTGGRKPARCPMCARPSDEAYRPFCSKRCANIDLSRWLSGGYVIPGNPVDTDGEGSELPGRRDNDDDQTS